MPTKGADDTAMPEAQGLKYDESEMALFHAKLSYHATIDQRMESQDSNLAAITDAQGKLLKRWELLRQTEKELVEQGKSLTPSDKSLLAQLAWRYKELEKKAATNDS
ncbi:hypothetical protein N7451_002826 [Penicillium sp. IBT 35674x]|uniref:Uncharacterized protein n=1 Tax=Penicillium frequentans TaxID=3151616 RepID=A0AAD6CZ32_9EURO|nr:hypothetical protein N7513_008458 [Penicillium glabrum]KAJ5541588.1 hypothetical protein N7494_006664 [Penicillium glabrum]KAJ6011414.1 hypothetical protein N7451_002826 [Penicillium sp. IBT 35674x]